MEDFVKNLGLDLLYGSSIAASCVIYEPVDAPVMLVNSTHGSARDNEYVIFDLHGLSSNLT